MNLRGQLLEDKEAELEAKKHALDEREKAVQRHRVRASKQLRVAIDLEDEEEWMGILDWDAVAASTGQSSS